MAKGNFLTGGIFVDGETPVLKSDTVMPVEQALQQTMQQPIAQPKPVMLAQNNVPEKDWGVQLDFSQPQQTYSANLPNRSYQAVQKSTTEYIKKGENLTKFQNYIKMGMSPEEAAAKFFNEPGQKITKADSSGKVEMQDYFRAYPTNDAFSLDKATLLKTKYGIGNKPMTTEQFAKRLEDLGYATQTDKQGNKIYAKQIVGTEARSNRVRQLILSPEFLSLSTQDQNNLLSQPQFLHNSFKSDSGVDEKKVATMKENIPIAWESAQKISKLLNNTVLPETLFAQMANETNYFTKPIANFNFSSVKINSEDRKNLRSFLP